MDDDCFDCTEEPEAVCPASQRPCGHHCNHGWTHDECCWCGTEWGEGGEVVNGPA